LFDLDNENHIAVMDLVFAPKSDDKPKQYFGQVKEFIEILNYAF
jgi:hypothetical protein